jgi:hypothetical protein
MDCEYHPESLSSIVRPKNEHLSVGRYYIQVWDNKVGVTFGHHGQIDFDLAAPDNSGLEELCEFLRE